MNKAHEKPITITLLKAPTFNKENKEHIIKFI
jgi:hypothetical protein